MDAATSGRTRQVAILAFDDMEVLDYAGPYEVFNVAGELTDPAAFAVCSVGLHPGQVVGRGGFTVLPRFTIADCPAPDVLVIPGGAGTRRLLGDTDLLGWVRSVSVEADVVASVCTGALVLAAAGLLDDRDATTHHGAFAELEALSPSTRIDRTARFVQAAPGLWTSGGISAGIDLSLELVARLAGSHARDAVVTEMEWGWPVMSMPTLFPDSNLWHGVHVDRLDPLRTPPSRG
ncbi:MAG TPA: DJ-1/PfpI family protein [Propionicimonas sp.]|nr:DJ-1/PfpI family protein [Propionicimonas sp.]